MAKDVSRLSLISYKDPYNPRNGVYRCSCGTLKSIIRSSVASGNTKSCDCYRKEASGSEIGVAE